MPINWNSVEALVHLLVCIYPDHKLDYKQIAKRWTEFYGEAVSYHSVEGFFRKVRKESKDLEDRGRGFGGAQTALPTQVPQVRQRTPKKTRTPDAVAHGRVQKTRSPGRVARQASTIKPEPPAVGISALTPSSMSTTSEPTEENSFTEDFAVFDFGIAPRTPNFQAPCQQYDMHGFDHESF